MRIFKCLYLKYFITFQTLFGAEGFLQKALKQYVDYHVPVEKMNTPKEVFGSLTEACDDFSAVSLNNVRYKI